MTFAQYCRTFLWVEDEGGNLLRFELNEAQRIVYDAIRKQEAAGRPVRILILKGRQQGMSTLCQMRLAWRSFTTPGLKCFTVAHKLGTTHELYYKLDRARKMMPEELRPEVDAAERGRSIRFKDTGEGPDSLPGASLRYDSAHDPDAVGRGFTAQFAHFTETPQWRNAEDTVRATLATIHDVPGTEIYVENTAKGATGWFYDTWCESMAAVERGETPYWIPVFVEWFRTPHYTRERRAGEPGLDPNEKKFQKEYGLTEGQVLWYRDKRRDYGDQVTEEYPSNWREAFLSSGMKFFRRDVMDFYREKGRTRDPLRSGRYRIKGRSPHGMPISASFGVDWQGPTKVFADPIPGHEYVIGLDFASGRAKDNSAFVVIDKEGPSIVATHRSKMMPEDVLAEAFLMAHAYNKALIVPERSGIGSAFVDRLVNEWGYRNTYRETDPTKIRFHKQARWGWATSNSTKQWLVEQTASLVHSKSLEIPDIRLIQEMDNFIYLDEEGKTIGAAEGQHDDLVMSLCFAVRGITAAAPMQRFTDRERPNRSHRPSVSRRSNY